MCVCCRLSGMSGWIRHVRVDASRFPTADRCVKAESALETQPRHLRHAAVSFPLTGSANQTTVSLDSKGNISFWSIFFFFKNVFVVKSDWEIILKFQNFHILFLAGRRIYLISGVIKVLNNLGDLLILSCCPKHSQDTILDFYSV